MADEDYNRKLQSLQKYIPFLKSMITQLKDPNRKNREQQLNKMESLYAMITDRKKKLKIETLHKCEDVISKLYEKVNHKQFDEDILPSKSSPLSTPASPSPTKELVISNPITIPTERLSSNFNDTKSNISEVSVIPKVDIYSSAGESLKQVNEYRASKNPDPPRPPISLDDLKTLEQDVHEKITSNASLKELDNLRNKIAVQIFMEDIKSSNQIISETEKLSHTLTSTDQGGKSIQSPIKEVKTPTLKSPKVKSGIVKQSSHFLKETDIFGSALSTIDDQIRDSHKKKEEKKSKDDKSKSSDKKEKEKQSASTSSDEKTKNTKSDVDLSGKNSFAAQEKALKDIIDKEKKIKSKSQHHKDKKESKIKDVNEKSASESSSNKSKSKESSKQHSDNNTSKKSGGKSNDTKKTDSKVVVNDGIKSQVEIKISETESENSKPTYRRLAEKYNPKPRSKPIVEAEVDKTVSAIIEAKMKSPPPQIPVLNKPTQISSSPTLTTGLPTKPDLSLGSTTTDIINKVVSQFCQNKKEHEQIKKSSPTKPTIAPIPLLSSAPTILSPTDTSFLPREDPRSTQGRASFDNRSNQDMITNKFVPPKNTPNFVPPMFNQNIPQTNAPVYNNFNAYNQKSLDFYPPVQNPMDNRLDFYPNQNPVDNMHKLDYYPPNAPLPSNQFCGGGPPLLSPEIPHQFNEHKHNFGLVPNQDRFLHNEDMRWRMEDNRQSWNRGGGGSAGGYDRRYNRIPTTYREYREMKERDPRLARQDSSRDSRDHRRDSSDIRDPRMQRDPRLNRNADPRLREKSMDRDAVMREKSVDRAVREKSVDRDGMTREKSVERERVREKSVDRSRTREKSMDRNFVREKSYDREFRGRSVEREKSADRSRGKSMDRSREKSVDRSRGKSVDRSREKSVDRSREKSVDRSREKSRDREKSVERESTERGRSRFREKSRPRSSKYDSKFDQIYGNSSIRSRSDSDETFISPLDSLYTQKEDKKTGKGYGFQPFRIPKIKKDDSDKVAVNKIGEEKTAGDENDLSDNKNVLEKELESENKPYIKVSTDVQSTSPINKTDTIEKSEKGVGEKPETNKNDNTQLNTTVESEENLPSTSDKSGEVEIKGSGVPQMEESRDCMEVSSSIQSDVSQDTSQKTNLENEKPSSNKEQNILAQFFANLLGSQNKNETKTALCSLISTFSNSFSPKELSKITKMLTSEENDSSSDNEEEKPSETDKKGKFVSEKDEPKEQNDDSAPPVLPLAVDSEGDTTTKVVKSKIKASNKRRSSSVSSLKDEEKAIIEDDSKSVENLEDVVVSVGERIKSRRRCPTPSPKAKKRSELDKLHEDIQDMFIRDGVLTATGKRMCRLLKQDPRALSPIKGTTSPRSSSKTRNKPGPQTRSKQASDLNTLKNMRVLISKMPFDKLEGRRLTRSMTEIENNDNSTTVVEDSVQEEEEDRSKKKESESEETDTEKDTSSQISENSQKTRVFKRKRGKRWAIGIIPKDKRRKKEHPSSEVLPEANALDEMKTNEVEVCLEPDKNYYFNFAVEKSFFCKLCSYNGRFITGHYKKSHPDSEVLSSRFSPELAAEAIKDSEENLVKYEKYYNSMKLTSKILYKCRFCDYSSECIGTYFYDHISIHTGEYRYNCPYCSFAISSNKSLRLHMTQNHKDQDTNKMIYRKCYNSTILFGFLCGECNFVQMNEKNLEEHVNIYHLQETTIYKINMSSIFDPKIEKNVKPLKESFRTKEISQNSNTEKDIFDSEKIVKPTVRKKPGPKPKNLAKNKNVEKSVSDLPSESSLKTTKKPDDRRNKSLSNEIETTDTSEVIPLRSQRAAKEKAQEKLKSLAESTNEPNNEYFLKNPSKDNETATLTEESTKDKPKKISAFQPNTDKNESNEENDESDKSDEIGDKVVLNEIVTNEPPAKKSIKSEVNLNVFTCKTDILEENKKIEQERLQKMEELNKSVGNRTSLNFVEKLCTRLSQNDVIIKQEPVDEVTESLFVKNTSTNTSRETMPVLEKSVPFDNEPIERPNNVAVTIPSPPITKKTVFESELPAAKTFDVIQKNDKIITNMIEKLKGKLGNVVPSDLENEGRDDEEVKFDGPPPLTRLGELPNAKSFDNFAKIYEVEGFIKFVKCEKSIVFCCLVPSCTFSADNKDTFEWHCKIKHKTATLGKSSALCEICGLQMTATLESNLLEVIFKHSVNDHKELLENETNKEDERVDTEFVKIEQVHEIPQEKPIHRPLRIRKLSGDALSAAADDENLLENRQSGNDNTSESIEYIDILDDSSPVTNEDNPFPFKIADVKSLAEPPQQQPPPLTPIAKEVQSLPQQMIVKEVKLSAIEMDQPKKTPEAMAAFIKNSKELYKCPHFYCEFSTLMRELFELHLKAHKTDNKLVPCVYCDMKTPLEHVPLHIDLRHAHCRFACSYCIYRAISKEYVFLHQDIQHSAKDYSVVALPLPKNAKYTIMEQQPDPKLLCEPFQCIRKCNAQFLFISEFRRHLRLEHGHNDFLMCGYPNCTTRDIVSRITRHWHSVHGIGLYQCGYCKSSSSELKPMYMHLAKYHSSLEVSIYARLLSPLLEITLGYTSEAFKRLRKINTLPKTENFFNERTIQTKIPPFIPVNKSEVAVNLFQPTSPQKKQTIPIPRSLISVLKPLKQPPSTITSSNILILSSASNVTPITTSDNTNGVITTVASCKQVVKVVPSTSQTTNEINKNEVEIVTRDDVCKNSPLLPSLKPAESKQSSEIDSIVVPVEQVLVNEIPPPSQIIPAQEQTESEMDPLDIGDLQDNSQAYSSEDDSDSLKSSDKDKNKSGLLSFQLFRCAFCDFSASNAVNFKKHVTQSVDCKIKVGVTKPFVCVHCKKTLRSPGVLVDHIQCHGILRFMCSLCEHKFPTSTQARNHMKCRHNITHLILSPLITDKNNINCDEFIVKPSYFNKKLKEAPPNEPATSTPRIENVYMPEETAKIPMRSIFSVDIKCGVCSYSTKVRTNLVRHLQFHSEEKLVPTTAPVNPVPCLEKNEKMFDKMVNLASSSHTGGGRMGGTKKEEKDKEKDHQSLPEFVPTYSRYACCAQGCQYICPEEANLRHHLIALHDGETSFTCVHCKTNLTPADADNLLKHFKLHGLQLYKCFYCQFIHHLKHKVEKHITDVHLESPTKVVVVRNLDADINSEGAPSGSQPVTMPRSNKPWGCCMCKTRHQTQEGIKNHVWEKHDIDSQYKCALCSYKTNDKDTFSDHFKSVHTTYEIDIINVYRKIEDGPKDAIESFDTTPLWQRDRPRVRHIRGILFDESSPSVPCKIAKKTTKCTASSTTAVNTVTKSSEKFDNLLSSIESVANGTADILKTKAPGSLTQMMQNVMEVKEEKAIIIENDEDSSIIIIDDDDDDDDDEPSETRPENLLVNETPNTSRGVKRKSSFDNSSSSKISKSSPSISEIEDKDSGNYTEDHLRELFGEFGTPINKMLKCPKCHDFRSKKISDFIFHMYKELRCYRFKCGLCSNETITYRYMYRHVKAHNTTKNIGENIIILPANLKLQVWLQMLLQKQSSLIMEDLILPTEIKSATPHQCNFCNKYYASELDKNKHSITHWARIPLSCMLCGKVAFTESVLQKHCRKQHAQQQTKIVQKGPTVAEEIKFTDNKHMKEVQDEVVSVLCSSYAKTEARDKSEDSLPQIKIFEFEDEMVDTRDILSIGDPLIEPSVPTIKRNVDKKPSSDTTSKNDCEMNDDLLLVSKTETNVPNDGDVFCCHYCSYMASSEMDVVNHITYSHDTHTVKFKVLNQRIWEETKSDYVGCVYCPEIGSEIAIRKHHRDCHEKQTYQIYRYTCSYCDKKFQNFFGVKVHTSRNHPGKIAKGKEVLNGEERSDTACDTPYASSKQTTSSIKKSEVKRYKCTLCNYTRSFPNSGVSNIKAHIRTHYRAFLCGICNARFKFKLDVINHHKKEHPEETESIEHDMTVENEYQGTFNEVRDSAVIVEDVKVKNTARKSTSAPTKKVLEEYSFYGVPIEEIDYTKIMTSVEINGVCLNTTADKLNNVLDLHPYVISEDCSLNVNLTEIFES